MKKKERSCFLDISTSIYILKIRYNLKLRDTKIFINNNVKNNDNNLRGLVGRGLKKITFHSPLAHTFHFSFLCVTLHHLHIPPRQPLLKLSLPP